MSKYIIAQFKCQPWHSLTELSGSGEDFSPKSSSTSKSRSAKAEKSKVQPAATRIFAMITKATYLPILAVIPGGFYTTLHSTWAYLFARE